jgi:hypothetical protein
MTMGRQMIAIVLCAALVTSGCASAGGARAAVAPAAPVVKQEVLADYAQRLPAGSRVKVETSSGGVVRGTLLKADAQALTLQRNTRIPEPPVDLALGTIARITLDERHGTSTAKAVAIGVASGAATFFGILLLIFATYDD